MLDYKSLQQLGREETDGIDRQLLMGSPWEELIAFQLEFLTNRFYSPFNELGRWDRFCHYLGRMTLGDRYDGELADAIRQLQARRPARLAQAASFSGQIAYVIVNDDGHPLLFDGWPAPAFNSTNVAEDYLKATGVPATILTASVNGFGRIHL